MIWLFARIVSFLLGRVNEHYTDVENMDRLFEHLDRHGATDISVEEYTAYEDPVDKVFVANYRDLAGQQHEEVFTVPRNLAEPQHIQGGFEDDEELPLLNVDLGTIYWRLEDLQHLYEKSSNPKDKMMGKVVWRYIRIHRQALAKSLQYEDTEYRETLEVALTNLSHRIANIKCVHTQPAPEKEK